MKRFRHITLATSGHGYTATTYLLKDGKLKELKTRTLTIDETNVRLKDNRPNWEEYVGGYGWDICESPLS